MSKRFTTVQVLDRAHSLGIALSVDKNDLKVQAAKGVLTQKILTVLKEYKAELIAAMQEEELQPLLCCICRLDANSVEDIFFNDENGALYCPLHWQKRTAPTPDMPIDAPTVSTDGLIGNDDIDLSSLMNGPVMVGDVRVLPSWYSYTIQDRAHEKAMELEAEDLARLSSINRSRYTQAS